MQKLATHLLIFRFTPSQEYQVSVLADPPFLEAAQFPAMKISQKLKVLPKWFSALLLKEY